MTILIENQYDYSNFNKIRNNNNKSNTKRTNNNPD